METSRIVLHEWQVRAWQSKYRFLFFCSGVQSGKTTFGAVWILNEAQVCGPGEYIVISPSYKVLQQSTLTRFLEIVPRGYGTYFKADSIFRTIDNRVFFLRSADKPESIEGITAKAIWADEASLMKANIWLMMQGRVSRTMGRILCTFTPIALNWIYKELEKDKERKLRGEASDIDFIQFRSVDSPYFPKEEFERARRTLSELQFRLRYEGVFGKAEGLVYPDFGNLHIVEPFNIPEDWQRIGGIDFGYNNPFVGLKGVLSPDDVLYIYEERYQDRAMLASHVDFLGGKIPYFADPSGAQEIAELRRLGMNVHEANNDIRLGIPKVTERIRKSTDDDRSIRLKVFKTCIRLIDEFSLYRYPESGGDKPLKVDDHSMDALRYLIMGLSKPERRIRWIEETGSSSVEEAIEPANVGATKEPEDPNVLALNNEEFAVQFWAALQIGYIMPQIAQLLGVDLPLIQRWRLSQIVYAEKIKRDKKAEIERMAEEIRAGKEV